MSERLEKLIDMDREAQNGFDVDFLDLNEMAIIPREDFEWLIEQAAELKNKILKQTEHNFEVLRNLEAKNQRYREAINKFFELDGNYKDIVNKAERIFAKALDEALESDNEND